MDVRSDQGRVRKTLAEGCPLRENRSTLLAIRLSNNLHLSLSSPKPYTCYRDSQAVAGPPYHCPWSCFRQTFVSVDSLLKHSFDGIYDAQHVYTGRHCAGWSPLITIVQHGQRGLYPLSRTSLQWCRVCCRQPLDPDQESRHNSRAVGIIVQLRGRHHPAQHLDFAWLSIRTHLGDHNPCCVWTCLVHRRIEARHRNRRTNCRPYRVSILEAPVREGLVFVIWEPLTINTTTSNMHAKCCLLARSADFGNVHPCVAETPPWRNAGSAFYDNSTNNNHTVEIILE